MINLRTFLILTLVFLAACASEAAVETFDRQAMLENITNQLILPSHATFHTTLLDLETATEAFVADPHADTLTALQETWLTANLARMAVLPYRLGPIDDSLLHNRLDKRPPRTAFIDETILTGEEALTDAYLEGIGSTSVGLAAMEYLLFNPETGNDAVLAAFTNAETGPRRLDYLLALAHNMPPKAEALTQIWAADGDNYAQTFIEADMDGGELQGSINMLINQMIADLEEIISSRLGKPAGKRSNGMVRPDLVEAPYSEASLPRIIATVEGLQTTFNGGAGAGLDDYLDFLGAEYEGEPLSEVIDAQFVVSLAALDAIDGSLETAVSTHPEQVDAAYEELHTLLVLLKVDMPNHLGITLTFNDNDGD
ncbi:MAG: imelysin family protein [Anaerolineae bacterium]|nr:imelysin family protein [Anaerolineae bacterium]